MSIVLEGRALGGRYELGPLLGCGGMGVVRSGWDRRLSRAVAVKTLRPELAERPDIRLRFEREAQAAARLTHPNAVAVFDVGEEDGMPYLVMEHVHGPTLAEEIGAGTVDIGPARRLAGAVLGALGAAHAAGIIHRDIKPSNILMGEDGVPKVSDFGIAKLHEDGDATGPATTEFAIGTVAYMAPERLHGGAATVQSDLFSVGAVLYQALTGSPPFRADTPGGLVWAVTSGQRTPLAELRPDLDPDFIAAVERALASRPEDRFADAAEMAAALGAGTDPPAEAAPTEARAVGAASAVVADDAPTIAAAPPTQVLAEAVAMSLAAEVGRRAEAEASREAAAEAHREATAEADRGASAGIPLPGPDPATIPGWPPRLGPRALLTAAAALLAMMAALAMAGPAGEPHPSGSTAGPGQDEGAQFDGLVPPILISTFDTVSADLSTLAPPPVSVEFDGDAEPRDKGKGKKHRDD